MDLKLLNSQLFTYKEQKSYSLLGDNDLMCEDLLKAQELGAKINLDLCSFKD